MDPVTEMLGWSGIPGHWHWYQENRRDGTQRWDISLNPPQPGQYRWACTCPAKPTHAVYENVSGTVLGDPLIIHRKEW